MVVSSNKSIKRILLWDKWLGILPCLWLV